MDKLEQLLTKMHSEFAEYETWLLQQPASVILDNAFQYTTKQDKPISISYFTARKWSCNWRYSGQ